MNEHILKTTIDEESAVASRRKFLKQLAYGSLLAISGSGVATAAVRHVIYPGRHRHSNVHPGRSHSQHHYSHKLAKHTSSPAGPFGDSAHKMLNLHNIHTGDKLKLTYFEQGSYIKDALQEINYLLRDYRTDDVHPIDTALLDQLFDLRQTLGVNRPFHIVSGYRSPLTNARLRKQGHGVAEHSLHMQGRAIDIRVEGVQIKTIRKAAVAMARGGVGYYPSSNFVHMDTGDFRTW